MDTEIIKIVVAPILVALVSWLIKDYLFAQQKAKQELLRAEWQKRLTTFWSPLFLWSGMILFPKYGDGKNIERAISELTSALAGNAHLLPRKHYFVIMSLIEKATVLPNKALDLKVINDTRAYIYRQIEILNYLLYRRDSSFDPLANTAFVGPPLALLRATANATIHLVTWGLLAGFFYLGYYLFSEGYTVGLIIYSWVLVLPLWADAERRIEIRKEAVDHRIVRNRYGLLAALRWLKMKLT
jgi:hypothetical protein